MITAVFEVEPVSSSRYSPKNKTLCVSWSSSICEFYLFLIIKSTLVSKSLEDCSKVLIRTLFMQIRREFA